MSETIGANGNELTITIPSSKQKNWATSIRDNCFQLISDHDHEGSGTGKKLLGYLALDLSEAVLPNDTTLKARNIAGTGTVDILKVNTSDEIVISSDIASATITALTLQGLTCTPTSFNGSSPALDNNIVNECTNTGGSSFTLANGTNGQMKIIISTASSGTLVITPATFANGSTITLDPDDTVTLVYNSANGWQLLSDFGAVIA